MKPTLEISEANFDAEVLKSAHPVIVDFYADWCGPCKMLAPVLDQIAAEQAGQVKVTRVNVDENPTLAERYRIRGLPTLLYFANGEIRNQTVGLARRKAILQKLESLAVTE